MRGVADSGGTWASRWPRRERPAESTGSERAEFGAWLLPFSEGCRTECPSSNQDKHSCSQPCHEDVKTQTNLQGTSGTGGTSAGTSIGNPQSLCVQTNSHSARMSEIAFISLILKALNFAVWS